MTNKEDEEKENEKLHMVEVAGAVFDFKDMILKLIEITPRSGNDKSDYSPQERDLFQKAFEQSIANTR